MKSAILYTDGASRGNPGPASIGYVVWEGDEILFQHGERIGENTNNVAEYTAVILGLQKCASLGIHEICIKSDSELLVKQIQGVYKVKAPHIVPLFQKVRDLLGHFKTYKVQHVRREENSLADALANEALDRPHR